MVKYIKIMKDKIDNYLKTRGLLFFVIFICVNIIAVLPVNNIIVDICTPKEEFYNIINQCISLGINNIIVEKPFMASKYSLILDCNI